MNTETDGTAIDRIADLPLGMGAIVGLASWVFGYVLTYVVVAPDIRESPLNRFIEAFEGGPATYEMVGWVFYNAHFVTTVFRDLPLVGSRTATFIGGEDGFTTALYLIPIGLLVASGIALARYHAVDSPFEGVLAGVTVLPPYLVLSVAGAFLFEVTVGGATGTPDLLPAVFIAGIAYPLFGGGLGGAIGSVLERRARSESAPEDATR